MTVVKRVGERFLWVDAYCMDRNNEVNKSFQIANMHLVYKSALLTIVAVDGTDSEAGLSGVSRPLQQRHQPVVEIDDYQLMATYVDPISNNQGKSSWDLRAWTLQELILSRGCLFFDQKHITMRCRRERFHDTMAVDLGQDRVPTLQDNTYFLGNGFGLGLNRRNLGFPDYAKLISNY